MISVHQRSLAVLLLLSGVIAAEDYIPKPGEFPPSNAGHYFAGELVAVDHVNRRGALRLVGDNESNRYHSAPSFLFAMLPYGSIRYHGAPAELRDIPIGTVLHGYFVKPREGDISIPLPKRGARYAYHYTHALTLEDDFSFYQRRKQSWKLTEVNLRYDSSSKQFPPLNKDGDWGQTPLHGGGLKATLQGDGDKDGLSGDKVFTVDRSTRIWRENRQIQWEDLAADDAWIFERSNPTRDLHLKDVNAQLALTWAPDWQNGQFHVTDIWLDDESRRLAIETQRQRHIRHMRHRWLPGWVDHVDHEVGGRGKVTITLFGGSDESLYNEIRKTAKSKGGVAAAAAEWTLRTWWQDHDKKGGRIVDFKEITDPPFGHSGLQLTIEFHELLLGYAPKRLIRLRPNSFPNVKLPPEERVQNMDQRIPEPYAP